MHAPSRRAAAALAALLLGAAALTGCGSDDATDAASDGTTSPTATPGANGANGANGAKKGAAQADPTPAPDVDLAVTLTGTKVDPPLGNVKIDEGDLVRLTVTRDTAGEIHVHGYEFDAVATAGKPVTFEFVADQVGVFEVESHDPDRLLTRLQVS